MPRPQLLYLQQLPILISVQRGPVDTLDVTGIFSLLSSRVASYLLAVRSSLDELSNVSMWVPLCCFLHEYNELVPVIITRASLILRLSIPKALAAAVAGSFGAAGPLLKYQ